MVNLIPMRSFPKLATTSQLKSPPVNVVQLIQKDLKRISDHLQSIRESASTEDYMLNKELILPVEVNRRKDNTMLNIFKRKNKPDRNKQSAEIRSIQKDMQAAAEQYEATRQQLLKNLELINSIL